MKDLIRLSALSLAIIFFLGTSMCLKDRKPQDVITLDPEEISWIEFCKTRGYDPSIDDEETVVEFLDTWRGSTEEEEALTRNGIPV